jgi:hypothetical protein
MFKRYPEKGTRYLPGYFLNLLDKKPKISRMGSPINVKRLPKVNPGRIITIYRFLTKN